MSNNALDLFESIWHYYGRGLQPEIIDDKPLLEREEKALGIYLAAREKITIYSGELYPFAAYPNFANKVIDHLKANPKIETTVVCGNVIACGYDENGAKIQNLLLRAIEDKEIKATVYHNYLDFSEQLEEGYFHAIIIDDGKHVMIETPHDYDGYQDEKDSNKIQRIYFQNNKDVVEALKKSFNKFIDYNKLPIVGIDNSIDSEKVNFGNVMWRTWDIREPKPA